MTGSHDDDVSAINDLRSREISAAESGDVDALLSLRTDDFTAMPPGQRPISGREAVAQFLRGMFGQMSIEESVTSDEVLVSGDMAYDRGTFTGTATPKGEGDQIELDGKYLWISRRDEGGAWKYVVQMWSDNA